MRRDDVPVILGPMAGVTDMPARLLALEQGASFCVTEMLSAKGLSLCPARRARDRFPHAARPAGNAPGPATFWPRTGFDRPRGGGAFRQGLRLHRPEHGLSSAQDHGNGEGSALMREPELAQAVAAAAVRATHLPVTVKIRAVG